MLSKYQLIIADVYKIPIRNVKKLMSYFFDQQKFVLYYDNLQLYLRLELNLKEFHGVLELNSTHTKNRSKTVETKMEKRCTN